MKTRTKHILLGMASVMALTACVAQEPGFEKDSQKAIAENAAMLADRGEAVRRGGAVDVDRPFLGRNMNKTGNSYQPDFGKPFPANLEAADALEIVTPEPVSVDQIDLLIQELTGLNVVIRTRYQDGEGDLNIPINSKMRVNHKGPISKLVRQIASQFDLAWEFDGETITFDRMDTRTYDVPLPASAGAISTSLSGVNVAGNSVSSTKNIAIDPWAELTEALASVVVDPGKVTVSRNSGQVTIFAPASVQEEAAKIVKTFDDLYSHRIGIEIATFYVDTERTAELATDLGISVGGNAGFSGSLGQGLVSAVQGGIGVISRGDGDVSFNLRNISGSSAIADYQMSNTIAQNGVVAPVVLTNSKRYVSQITQATGGEEGEGPSVLTDNINSGISIYALPRLMKNGKIQMSIWLTQSELNSLDTFDTGSGFVQLPDADQRAVEYTLIMEPGETLVMGGYEQERATNSRDAGIGGLGSLGLKNSKEGGTQKSRMVLMVRPTLIGN